MFLPKKELTFESNPTTHSHIIVKQKSCQTSIPHDFRTIFQHF